MTKYEQIKDVVAEFITKRYNYVTVDFSCYEDKWNLMVNVYGVKEKDKQAIKDLILDLDWLLYVSNSRKMCLMPRVCDIACTKQYYPDKLKKTKNK